MARLVHITPQNGIFGQAYIRQGFQHAGRLWQLLMGTAMVPPWMLFTPPSRMYSSRGGAGGCAGSMFSIQASECVLKGALQKQANDWLPPVISCIPHPRKACLAQLGHAPGQLFLVVACLLLSCLV